MLPPLVRPEDPGVDQTPPGTHQAYREEQLLGTAASGNSTWGFGSIGLSPKRPTTSTYSANSTVLYRPSIRPQYLDRFAKGRITAPRPALRLELIRAAQHPSSLVACFSRFFPLRS